MDAKRNVGEADGCDFEVGRILVKKRRADTGEAAESVTGDAGIEAAEQVTGGFRFGYVVADDAGKAAKPLTGDFQVVNLVAKKRKGDAGKAAEVLMGDFRVGNLIARRRKGNAGKAAEASGGMEVACPFPLETGSGQVDVGEDGASYAFSVGNIVGRRIHGHPSNVNPAEEEPAHNPPPRDVMVGTHLTDSSGMSGTLLDGLTNENVPDILGPKQIEDNAHRGEMDASDVVVDRERVRTFIGE